MWQAFFFFFFNCKIESWDKMDMEEKKSNWGENRIISEKKILY